MWKNYFFKLVDSWVPILENFPRWQQFNTYPHLFDPVTPATTGSLFSYSGFTYPVSGVIPGNWILPVRSPITSGSLTQGIFETYAFEKQSMLPSITSAFLNNQFFYDTADPQWAWIVTIPEIVTSVSIVTSSGNISIPQASDELSLFQEPVWQWVQQNQYLLITNLHIQEQVSTYDSNYWQFISNASTWTSGSIVWLEHPVSKNWLPLHPTTVGPNGCLNYIVSGNVNIRTASDQAALMLPTVNVVVNGYPMVAKRVNLTTSVDEKSIWFNLSRREGETSEQLSDAMLAVSWFGSQDYTGFSCYLSGALRTYAYSVFAPSSTGFTIPTNTGIYKVQGYGQYGFKTEKLVTDLTNSNYYYTRMLDPIYGIGFINNVQTDFTSASGLVDFNSYVDSTTDNAIVQYYFSNWTATGNTVQFTPNLDPTSIPSIVLFPQKVNVIPPDQYVQIESFDSTSTIYKWEGSLPEVIPVASSTEIFGLGSFDF